MARSRTSPPNRLSVEDWIQAGYAILAEEGIKALKIDRLCQCLGVTKGSFYWHFTDMAGYRADSCDRGPSYATMTAASSSSCLIFHRANDFRT